MLHIKTLFGLLSRQRKHCARYTVRNSWENNYDRDIASSVSCCNRNNRSIVDLIGRICIVLSAVLLMILSGPVVYAEQDDPDKKRQEIAENIISELRSTTDESVNDVISEYSLAVDSEDNLSKLSLSSIISKLIKSFTDNLREPLKMLGKLMAAAILCTMAQSLLTADNELSEIYRVIGMLGAVLAVYDCLDSCIELVTKSLDSLSAFMLSYIPIFSGVAASLGNYTAGSGYYASDLFLCECLAFVTGKLLIPLLSVLTAVSVVGAVNPDIKLGKTAGAVKKVIQWILGIIMVIFSGTMTLKAAVGSASDTLKARTVRFAASSFIPYIGGAVSESYSTLRSSLSVIKAGTGSVGMIIMAVLILRPLIIILAVRAVLALSGLFCDILGRQDMSGFLSSCNNILAIGMSIMICFSMMFIISTAIVMMTSMNIGV